jgi:hypothetical protein
VIDNPYWEQIKHLVTKSRYPYEGPQVGDSMNFRSLDGPGGSYFDVFRLRRELTAKYSWSVPSPDAVDFVVKHSNGSILDPMAGTGYWEFLLRQAGVDCDAFDLIPPDLGPENLFHIDADTHVEVIPAAAEVSAALAVAGQTLFLSWPPMSDAGARAVKAYPGNRLIYIGEGHGGCTGDDEFFDLLDTQWQMGDVHKLPQWSGIHDFISVYDRIGTVPRT